MAPAPTSFDNILPAASSALFSLPKLADDGSNWVTYKERLLNVISVRGLMRYVNGRAAKPIPFEISMKTHLPVQVDGSVTTEEEQEAQDDKIDEWYQNDVLVKQ